MKLRNTRRIYENQDTVDYITIADYLKQNLQAVVDHHKFYLIKGDRKKVFYDFSGEPVDIKLSVESHQAEFLLKKACDYLKRTRGDFGNWELTDTSFEGTKRNLVMFTLYNYSCDGEASIAFDIDTENDEFRVTEINGTAFMEYPDIFAL